MRPVCMGLQKCEMENLVSDLSTMKRRWRGSLLASARHLASAARDHIRAFTFAGGARLFPWICKTYGPGSARLLIRHYQNHHQDRVFFGMLPSIQSPLLQSRAMTRPSFVTAHESGCRPKETVLSMTPEPGSTTATSPENGLGITAYRRAAHTNNSPANCIVPCAADCK